MGTKNQKPVIHKKPIVERKRGTEWNFFVRKGKEIIPIWKETMNQWKKTRVTGKIWGYKEKNNPQSKKTIHSRIFRRR